MMGSLEVFLTAILVNNPVSASDKLSQRTKVEIDLLNSTGCLEVEDYKQGLRSMHRFTVKEATDVGYGTITVKQCEWVLALSCSLTNPKALFSSWSHEQRPASIESEAAPSKQEIIHDPTKSSISIAMMDAVATADHLDALLTTPICLYEDKILDVAKRILAAKIFETTVSKTLVDLNLAESLKAFQQACDSTDQVSCYDSLYRAFEKAVNTDGNDRTGKSFDEAAHALTGLAKQDIEGLRLFNNRLKHSLRDNKDISTLRIGEENLAQLSTDLKRAADSAILSRLGEG